MLVVVLLRVLLQAPSLALLMLPLKWWCFRVTLAGTAISISWMGAAGLQYVTWGCWQILRGEGGRASSTGLSLS